MLITKKNFICYLIKKFLVMRKFKKQLLLYWKLVFVVMKVGFGRQNVKYNSFLISKSLSSLFLV